jgi:PKD repeat protein
MKKNKTILFTTLIIGFIAIAAVSGCKKENNTPQTCSNGVKDGDETGVDCGGSCTACAVPVACFTADDSVLANASIQFTDCSQNAISYNWNFGDGGTSTDVSPGHIYTANGTYTVTLTVTNTAGSNSTTRTVIVFGYTSADYTGSFSGPEVCSTSGTFPTYTVQVTANGTYGIVINNFGNFSPAVNVTANLTGGDFTIPSQTHGTILISGYGSLTSNKQNLVYTYIYSVGGGVSETCNASLTRQ